MPYYTQILSHQSPNAIYHIFAESIILIPSGPYKKAFGNGGYALYDSINFFTDSKTKSDHITLLRRFCIIYSFLFKDVAVYMFDEGELTDHIETDSYQKVPVNYDCGRKKVDFDDILGQIYFMNKPIGKISFKVLYNSTKDDFLNYFTLFLDPIGQISQISQKKYSPDYFIFNRSYLKIVNYITLLETIIGHDVDCDEVICVCESCGKKEIRHRKGSENQWIKKYLSDTLQNQTLEKSYFEIIAFARDIRHKTTHSSKLPTAKFIMQDTSFEEYGFDRSKKEYKDNDFALKSIILAIDEITYYLVLNHCYSIKQFFPVNSLKVVSF